MDADKADRLLASLSLLVYVKAFLSCTSWLGPSSRIPLAVLCVFVCAETCFVCILFCEEAIKMDVLGSWQQNLIYIKLHNKLLVASEDVSFLGMTAGSVFYPYQPCL